MRLNHIILCLFLIVNYSCSKEPKKRSLAHDTLHPTVREIFEASGVPKDIYFSMKFKDFAKAIDLFKGRLKPSNQERLGQLWRYYYMKEDEEGKFKYEFVFYNETLYKYRVRYSWDYSNLLAEKIEDIWGNATQIGRGELIWKSDLFALLVRKNSAVSDWPSEVEFEWRGISK